MTVGSFGSTNALFWLCTKLKSMVSAQHAHPERQCSPSSSAGRERVRGPTLLLALVEQPQEDGQHDARAAVAEDDLPRQLAVRFALRDAPRTAPLVLANATHTTSRHD